MENNVIHNIYIDNFSQNDLNVIDLFENKMFTISRNVDPFDSEFFDPSIDEEFISLRETLINGVIAEGKRIVDKLITCDSDTSLTIDEQFTLRKYFLLQCLNHPSSQKEIPQWKEALKIVSQAKNNEMLLMTESTLLQPYVQKVLNGIVVLLKSDEPFLLSDNGYGAMVVKYELNESDKETFGKISSAALKVYGDTFYLHEFYAFPIAEHYTLIFTSFLADLFLSFHGEDETDLTNLEKRLKDSVVRALNGMKIKVASSVNGDKMSVSFENSTNLPLPLLKLDHQETIFFNSFLLNQANRYVAVEDKAYFKTFVEGYNCEVNDQTRPLYDLDFLLDE